MFGQELKEMGKTKKI